VGLGMPLLDNACVQEPVQLQTVTAHTFSA
jgi:hypothetical protein